MTTIRLTSINEDTRERFQRELDAIKHITRDCRPDMHEPDEQGLEANVFGRRFDNAGFTGELRVILTRPHDSGNGESASINLANLIAIARTADLTDETRKRGEEATNLLLWMLNDWREVFEDEDAEISGADAVDWLCDFYREAETTLSTEPPPPSGRRTFIEETVTALEALLNGPVAAVAPAGVGCEERDDAAAIVAKYRGKA